jgi:putative cell wall-binding protein
VRTRTLRHLGAVVVTAALPAALLVAPAGAHHDAVPRPGDHRQVVTITYPADPATTSFTDSYDAPRSGGRVHKAADVMGRKLTPLYAAANGTVCHLTGVAEPMPSWGYSLTICEDGRDRRHRYIHLNNDNPGTDDGHGGPEWAFAPGIRRGATVRAGQWVGYMGDSGNAEDTAPHLHYEILDDTVTDPYGDHRIDPTPSLRAARAAGRAVTGAPVQPPPTPLMRVAGPDRVATAIAASRVAWPTPGSSPVAVLAVSTTPQDAVVAGPYAASLDAPVLITHPSAIDRRVAAEVARLGARRVVLIGEAARIPGADAALGSEVERIAGSSHADTAARVAAAMWADTPARGRTALLALGEHPDPDRTWPDALMAGWYGAVTGAPVLLSGPTSLPPATRTALAGLADVTVVGGEAAVSGDAVASLLDAVGGRVQVRRLAGPTRYDTASAVTAAVGSRADRRWVWAATGRGWADAVTAAAAVARTGETLVLIDGAQPDAGVDAGTGRWLFANAADIRNGRVLGGDAAVSGPAAARLAHRTR